MIKWIMPDGSVFKMEGMQEKAFKMKIEAEGITEEQAKKVFIPEVEFHWKNKTVPTKFGDNVPWKEEWEKSDLPKNMADLANGVIYPKIRAAMMGLMMAKMAKEDMKKKGKKKTVVPKVIALNNDGSATSYSDKVEKHERWEDAVPNTKTRKTSNRNRKA
jgi:hypothetical protein